LACAVRVLVSDAFAKPIRPSQNKHSNVANTPSGEKEKAQTEVWAFKSGGMTGLDNVM